MISYSIFWSSIALYCSAFAFALISILRKKDYLRTVFYSLFGGGFLMHGIGLYYRGTWLGSIPLSNTFEILQVITWSVAFLTIIIQISFRLKLLGFFGVGLACLLGVASILIPGFDKHDQVNILTDNPWVEFHAALAIFAYGAFALLAVTSLMYIIQDYSLSRKRFGRFFSLLPSLQQLLSISVRLLLLGVIAFSLSALIGTLSWLESSSSLGLGKLISAWGLFICYTSLLLLKTKNYIQPRKFAFIAFLLFILAILSLWPL